MSRVEDCLAVQVSQRPDAFALTDSTGLRWSYRELDIAAASLADDFAAQGVHKGDRAIVLAETCGAAVAALLADWQIGAIAVPVKARQSGSEINQVLQYATP